MRSRVEETAGRPLTPGYEPSIDELLNDPIAEAIMRYDQITRQDVYRVISQVIVRRAVARNGRIETADSSTRGAKAGSIREADMAS